MPLSFELGGKSPLVVFADADLDLAVDLAVEQFDNAGQVCLGAFRILVQDGVAEAFLERVRAKAATLVLGDPREEATDVSALVSRSHFERVDGFVRRALDAGARAVLGGGPSSAAGGLYYAPTILVNAAPGSEILTEEVFGPVLTVQTFSTEDEAVAMANDTRFGLAATLVTGDAARAERVSDRLNAGTVWVNCFFVRDLGAPFGGNGKSGIGREGGRWSFDFYSDVKNTVFAPIPTPSAMPSAVPAAADSAPVPGPMRIPDPHLPRGNAEKRPRFGAEPSRFSAFPDEFSAGGVEDGVGADGVGVSGAGATAPELATRDEPEQPEPERPVDPGAVRQGATKGKVRMGEVVGAGLLAHVPTIVLPEAIRRELNNGEDSTLVSGLQQLRREVFDTLDYDTVVVLDSHWATTVEFVVTAQARRHGLFTSEELPRGMCRRPYDFLGDPELARLIEARADAHGTWITAIEDDHLPIFYATTNLWEFLGQGLPDKRWISIGVCQTADTEDNLRLGRALGDAIAASDRRVVLIASGAMSHTFWPLRQLRDHEAAGVEHIFTPEAAAADFERLEWFSRGDHARVLATMPEFYRYKPEARFGHYLMMIGALGEGDCRASSRRYGEYENSVGTGQVHLWFDRPEGGFPRPRRTVSTGG